MKCTGLGSLFDLSETGQVKFGALVGPGRVRFLCVCKFTESLGVISGSARKGGARRGEATVR